jgi:hypothetical protein
MFEEYPEGKTKKYLKIGIILVVSLILVFLLVKVFILKPKKPQVIIPPPPEEVKIKWPGQEIVELKKNVFLRLIKIEDYVLEDIKPEEGFKLLSLEVEFENKSNESVRFRPFYEWKVISTTGNFYTPIYPWVYTPPAPLNPLTRKPVLFLEEELAPGDIERGYISFHILEKISIKEVVFQTPQKKIIFEIP